MHGQQGPGQRQAHMRVGHGLVARQPRALGLAFAAGLEAFPPAGLGIVEVEHPRPLVEPKTLFLHDRLAVVFSVGDRSRTPLASSGRVVAEFWQVVPE